MKPLIALLLGFAFFVSACKRTSTDHLVVQTIEYDVLLNNYGTNFFWFDNIDGFLRQDIFRHILENVRSGRFRLESIDGKVLNIAEAEQMLTLHIKTEHQDTIIQLTYQNLNGLRFREHWSIDTITGKIEKTVLAICPLYYFQHKYTDASRKWHVFPLFWIYPLEQKNVTEYIVPYIAYDVFLDNTVEDVRLSYEQPVEFYFSNIQQPLRRQIIQTLLTLTLKEDKLPAYDFFLSPLHAEQYLIYRKDFLNQSSDTASRIIEAQKIVKLKFIETWKFYPESNQMIKEVLAVSPMSLSYNEEGELRGYTFYFWSVYNEKKLQNIPFE